MVTRTCDPSIQEVEAGRSGVQGQLQLHSKLPATEDPSQKKKKKKTRKKKKKVNDVLLPKMEPMKYSGLRSQGIVGNGKLLTHWL